MRSQISGIGRRRYRSMRCVRRYSGKRYEERQRSGRGDGWTTREGRGKLGREGVGSGVGGGRESVVDTATFNRGLTAVSGVTCKRGQADPCFM